jgi:cobalt/nickel transport system permease protein
MGNLGDRFAELGTLDALGSMDSPIHRLDPRAKVLATLCFLVAVASFGRYEVSALLPFVFFPVVLTSLGRVPARYVLKRVLLALPFVLVLGAFNPILDRKVLTHIGEVAITGGWISFASMVLRLALTVAAGVALVATTGLDGVCRALERLGLPEVFVMQIAFLHRYSFVLVDESGRMLRAREQRSNGRNLSLREFGVLLGHLLLRTWDRARRIHLTMLARGFEGHFHMRGKGLFRTKDLLFLVAWGFAFLFMRLIHVPRLLEAVLSGGLK